MAPEILSTDIDLSRIPLTEFKKLKDAFPGQHDEDLARFLLVREGNYTLAYDLFRRHLDWLEMTPKPTKESIMNCLRRKWLYHHGFDREGHPLLIAKIARHNKEERDLEEMKREQLWWFDHVRIVMQALSLIIS